MIADIFFRWRQRHSSFIQSAFPVTSVVQYVHHLLLVREVDGKVSQRTAKFNPANLRRGVEEGLYY